VVRLGEGDVDIEVADGVVVTFVNGAVQSRTAYEARLAPRGGARGFGGFGGLGGARTAPTTTDVTDDQASHESDPWSSDGADEDAHEAGDGDAGGSGNADWAHGDGGAEPSGGGR
jgi:hypothetical protein